METNTTAMADRSDIRVLIVDGSKMLREALAELMCYLPGLHCVGGASSGAEAIHMTRAHCPDTILVDSGVPDMEAAEVIRRVRELHPQVRIVAYSMQPGDGVEQAFRDAGADAFVDKGGGVDDLVATIRALGAVPEPYRSGCEGRARDVA